jgi:vancomycin resistance protein YoaR
MTSPFYQIDPPGLNAAVAYIIYPLALKNNFLAPFQLEGKIISRAAWQH